MKRASDSEPVTTGVSGWRAWFAMLVALPVLILMVVIVGVFGGRRKRAKALPQNTSSRSQTPEQQLSRANPDAVSSPDRSPEGSGMSSSPSWEVAIIEQEIARCVHLTSLDDVKCKAGVEYKNVKVPLPSPIEWRSFGVPCLASDGCGECAKRQFPTREEAEKSAESIVSWIRSAGSARRHIIEHSGGKRNVGGVMECPTCKGTLRYGIGPNGHVHARCDTPNCVSMIE
jgi:hypothetical protein